MQFQSLKEVPGVGAPPPLLDFPRYSLPCMALGTPPLQFRMVVNICFGHALSMTLPSQFVHISYRKPLFVVSTFGSRKGHLLATVSG